MLQIAHVRRSTPTVGLELIYNIEPLDLFIRGRAADTFVRIKPKIDWVPKNTCKRNQGHLRLVKKMVPEEILNSDHDPIIPVRYWERNFTVGIEGDGKDCELPGIHAYTDGSLKDGAAGAG
jgi:hypothetical protein